MVSKGARPPALFLGILIMTLSMGTVTADPYDLPPVVEIVLEETEGMVNLSDLTGSHEVEFNGHVETHYPGVVVQVDLSATCPPHGTTVDPIQMLLVGKQFAPFVVKVDIRTVTNESSFYTGTFAATATISAPGITRTDTYMAHFTIMMEGNGKNGSYPVTYDPDGSGSAPDMPPESYLLDWVMTVMIFGLAAAVFYIGERQVRVKMKRYGKARTKRGLVKRRKPSKGKD